MKPIKWSPEALEFRAEHLKKAKEYLSDQQPATPEQFTEQYDRIMQQAPQPPDKQS